MAVNRTQQSGLTIALIVFVMLTFILAAATYFGFSGWRNAFKDQVAAEKQAESSAADLRQAQKDTETLRLLIDDRQGISIAEIETGFTARLEGDFDGFDLTAKTYNGLLTELRGQLRDLAGKVHVSDTKASEKFEELQQKVSELRQAVEAADKRATGASERASAAEADYAAGRKTYEESLAALNRELDDRRTAAKRLQAIEAQINKFQDFKDLLTEPNDQIKFLAADSVEKASTAYDLMFQLQRSLKDLEARLATMREPSPAAQELVAAATASDDRIDGFDGRIANIDSRRGTVLIASRTTAGLRPGLILQVFDPADPRPEFGSRKAVVQVTEVESPTTARASILRESTADPILAGDGVSSSLWSAASPLEIVIVGFADLDGDGRSDRKQLVDLVQKSGGMVRDNVTSNTALVVDLGVPSGPDIDRIAPDWPTEERRANAAREVAKENGIRIRNTADLLDLLGLEPDAFAAGRFPRQRDTTRLPPVR